MALPYRNLIDAQHANFLGPAFRLYASRRMSIINLTNDCIGYPFLFRDSREASFSALFVNVLLVSFGEARSKFNERKRLHEWLAAMSAFESTARQEQVDVAAKARKISYLNGLLRMLA